MLDIIYKTAKKANYTKYKSPNVPNHLHIFWLNSDKANRSFLHPFLLLGETDFQKKCCQGEWVISHCLGCDGKDLGESFEWEEGGEAWVKMPRFNGFSRNVNTINLKILPTYSGIYKFVRTFSKHSGERKSPMSLQKYERMYPWG